MNEPPKEIFDELLTRWIEEFGRAVDMYTGEKPIVTLSKPETEISAADIAKCTWWKQVIHSDKPFAIWAGGTESIWNALGEGQQAQSVLFDMVSQANQGTADALSDRFSVALRCREGRMEAPVDSIQTESAQIAITFRGADIGRLILLLEKSALAILRPNHSNTAIVAVDREEFAAMGANPAMLSRLLDLRLPVSVLLGRAKVTIKDALKLMPGSVIELDRKVGDYVEIIVHGTVVAKGEIVSVKGNYGVRIKEVISRQDRLALHEAA